jgi:hypothetical protein
MLAQIETAMKAIDKATAATDRWLFLAALVIIMAGGSIVIRWLVLGWAQKDRAHDEAAAGMRTAHLTERAGFLAALSDQRADFRAELSKERHECAQERILDREARHATANALNQIGLTLALLSDHDGLPAAKGAAKSSST